MSANRKSSPAPLAMTILFLSLAIVPVSMKAAGFNPKLSAVVDAWNRIASVFGDGYQSASTTELLALNQSSPAETVAPASESYDAGCLMACAEQTTCAPVESASTCDVEEAAACETQKACTSAPKRSTETKRIARSSTREAEVATKEFSIVAVDVQEMTKVAPAISVETVRAIERQASLHKVNLERALKNLPAPKEMKIYIKAKSLATAQVSQVSRCAGTLPVLKSEGRWSMIPTRFETVQPATSETSEL